MCGPNDTNVISVALEYSDVLAGNLTDLLLVASGKHKVSLLRSTQSRSRDCARPAVTLPIELLVIIFEFVCTDALVTSEHHFSTFPLSLVTPVLRSYPPAINV